VCYGKGTGVTVTDANLYLGRLHPRWFLGGQMQLDVARAREAVVGFAHQVHMSPEAACEGILEVVNANMEGDIRVISVERGHDPREFALVSFGGAGGMHAADLARHLSIPTVLVPANPGILSAFGMLITDYVQEYAQTVLVPATAFTPERAAVAFGELEERGRQAMRDEGVAPQDVQMSRFLDMSYVGQSFELLVPYIPNFIDEFHRRHDMRYGYEDSARPTQVVNVRMRVVGPSGTSYRATREREQGEEASAAQVDAIAMYSDGQWCQAPVYDRQRLHAGNRLSGPALITEYSATTVVPADFVVHVDQQHNLILRPSSSPSPTGRG
jgi:N-methylhydantoinase A